MKVSAQALYRRRLRDTARLLDVLEMEVQALPESIEPDGWRDAAHVGSICDDVIKLVMRIADINREAVLSFLAECEYLHERESGDDD